MDIVSEGGTAVMAGVWFLFTLSSRPGGRVTSLIAGGLAPSCWAPGPTASMNSSPSASHAWDNWLEALVPLGMLC
jgi:hypothetical protein